MSGLGPVHVWRVIIGAGCQWPGAAPRWRPSVRPAGGRGVVPSGGQLSPRRWCWWGLAEGLHPLAGGGLGEPEAVTLGDHDVGVVQQPVDGGGGQGLGHDLVES